MGGGESPNAACNGHRFDCCCCTTVDDSGELHRPVERCALRAGVSRNTGAKNAPHPPNLYCRSNGAHNLLTIGRMIDDLIILQLYNDSILQYQ